ncbi:MAG: hypothetical protein JWM32_552 [Verrucomicrobia bacterium]|nr:hypothetical protein [Verrucomicrobiota bacterium]
MNFASKSTLGAPFVRAGLVAAISSITLVTVHAARMEIPVNVSPLVVDVSNTTAKPSESLFYEASHVSFYQAPRAPDFGNESTFSTDGGNGIQTEGDGTDDSTLQAIVVRQVPETASTLSLLAVAGFFAAFASRKSLWLKRV